MQTVVKEPNRKRRKTHTEQCKDDACNGCAVGEICIDLVDEEGHDLSNPLEIFKAAKEEQNKASLTDQDIDSSTHSTIVTKLYEKALKEFERLEILDLSYCSCLFEMGLFIQVKEYFEKTEAALEQYLKGPLTSTNYSDALLLLGRVYLELAHYCLGDAEESDSDTEFIPANKKEQKYVQKAVNSFNKNNEDMVNAQLIASGALLDHALLQKSRHLLPSVIISTVKECLQLAPEDKNNLLACRICGTASFHLASLESHRTNPTMTNALRNVKNAISLLEKVTTEHENPILSDFQILGQAWLLLSSLETDDDDKAIEAFDAGAAALKMALTLDPENLYIRQQLSDMQMLNDDDSIKCYSS